MWARQNVVQPPGVCFLFVGLGWPWSGRRPGLSLLLHTPFSLGLSDSPRPAASTNRTPHIKLTGRATPGWPPPSPSATASDQSTPDTSPFSALRRRSSHCLRSVRGCGAGAPGRLRRGARDSGSPQEPEPHGACRHYLRRKIKSLKSITKQSGELSGVLCLSFLLFTGLCNRHTPPRPASGPSSACRGAAGSHGDAKFSIWRNCCLCPTAAALPTPPALPTASPPH